MILASLSFLHGRVRVNFRTPLLAQPKTIGNALILATTRYQPWQPVTRWNFKARAGSCIEGTSDAPDTPCRELCLIDGVLLLSGSEEATVEQAASTVMVVEDDTLVRETLATMLEEAAISVVQC